MEPNTEYHAIPMSASEAAYKPERPNTSRSFSLPHLSGPKALVLSVAILCATLGTVYYHQQSVSKIPQFGTRLASDKLPSFTRGQLQDICNEFDGHFSYGCWNSGASDTDLCKICKNLRIPASAMRMLPARADAPVAPVAPAAPAAQLDPAMSANLARAQLQTFTRGQLQDICNEFDGHFSYGCWNSGASDTDLCKICKNLRIPASAMRMLPARADAPVAPVAPVAPAAQLDPAMSANLARAQLQTFTRGQLQDICNEFSRHFSSGCWNSSASGTDLCKICSNM